MIMGWRRPEAVVETSSWPGPLLHCARVWNLVNGDIGDVIHLENKRRWLNAESSAWLIKDWHYAQRMLLYNK